MDGSGGLVCHHILLIDMFLYQRLDLSGADESSTPCKS